MTSHRATGVSGYLTPETYRDLANHGDRIAALEKAWGKATDADIIREICFALPGLVQPTTSPQYHHPTGAQLVRVLVSLGTGGTSATVVQPLLNNTVVSDPVTLTSGVTLAAGFFGHGVVMVQDQTALTMQIVTAGVGAKDLTAQVRFSPIS